MLLEAGLALALCATPRSPEPGYRMAFDGTRASLRSWTQTGAGRFALTSRCRLRSRGGIGLLRYERRLRRPYTVRATWRMVGDSNSGVFVGPYEVQIDATDDADSTTGAIYNLAAPDAALRDRALRRGWNTFTITVRGSRIVVRLNGVAITHFTAPGPVGGRIGLQNHSAADVVEFRDVQVR
jgi:hypothetical protein